MASLWAWWTRRRQPRADLPTEVRQAVALLRAIDAGGVPLNPARVNAIARALGLEVSRTAPMGDTLVRIRQALHRLGH